MDSITEAADRLLRESWYSISNLRLNKLLYYVYGVYLARNDIRPWGETPLAAPQGPIFETVYDSFKTFGAGRIRSDFKSKPNLSKELEGVIFSVWNKFGKLTEKELIRRVLADNTPWANAFEKRIHIPDKETKEYFKRNVLKWD